MRQTNTIRTAVAAAVGLALSAGVAGARTVSTYNDLAGREPLTTVTFDDRTTDDGTTLAALGQPYLKRGLILPTQAVVGGAKLSGGLSGGAAIRSTAVAPAGNVSVQSIGFDVAVRKAGLVVCDRLATGITVAARDRAGRMLESVSLPGGAVGRFVGFARETADISEIRVEAAHASPADAAASPTLVDDISFPGDTPAGGVSGGGGAQRKDVTGGGPLVIGPADDGGGTDPNAGADIGQGTGSSTGAEPSTGAPRARSAPLSLVASESISGPGGSNDPAPPLTLSDDPTVTPSAPGDNGDVPDTSSPPTTARTVVIPPAIPPASQTTVPEPAAVVAGLLLVPLLMARRRQETERRDPYREGARGGAGDDADDQ